MSLDIIIERPAAPEGPVKSEALALVRIPGVSLTRSTKQYSYPEDEEEAKRVLPREPLDMWFVTDRLDDILEEPEPIFVDSLEDAEQQLKMRYGSVDALHLYRGNWRRSQLERFSSDGEGFSVNYGEAFVCVHGTDMNIDRTKLIQHVQENGSATFYTAGNSPTKIPALKEEDTDSICPGREDIRSLGGGVYMRTEYQQIYVVENKYLSGDTRLGNLTCIKVFHDPKRAQRQESARKSGEKRRANNPPQMRVLQRLEHTLCSFGSVGEVRLGVNLTRNGKRLDKSELVPVLVRMIEIQILLDCPYRQDLNHSWTLRHALRDFQAVLRSEVGMLKDPALAPLVPWLKDEVAWMETKRVAEPEDVA